MIKQKELEGVRMGTGRGGRGRVMWEEPSPSPLLFSSRRGNKDMRQRRTMGGQTNESVRDITNMH